MWKKWKAARKLKKFRRENPRKNVDSNGNVIIDESHVVCFVNNDFPKEQQMLSLIDATSKWFYTFGSTQIAVKWHDRISNPMVYLVSNHFEMMRIKEQFQIMGQKHISSCFAGEVISVCIGPIWNSKLDSFNLYDRIEYE